jgi:DNA invertase Pin-like site-specific DNA recombinase
MMNWGEFPKMKKSSRYFSQDALHKAGCDRIFTDTASGSKTERVGLEEALRYARKGDTFVVWRLDRLGRSLPHLIATMTSLGERDSCQSQRLARRQT